jgi:predicted RNase H-like nuclease (RuvC/YqgF family)
MDERIETVSVGIRSLSYEVKKNETSNKSFENQLEKFESEVREKIDSVDGKIVALEAKIEEKIEGKFNEFNETLKILLGYLNRILRKRRRKQISR